MGILRAALSFISLGSVAYGAGRNLASKRVDKSVDQIIETALLDVRQRIRTEASDYLRGAWREYYLTTGIKLLVICAIASLLLSNVVSPKIVVIACSATLTVFFIYDVIRRRTLIAATYRNLQRFGPKPKKITKHLVTEHVFAEVLAQSEASKVSRVQSALIRLSGQSQTDLQKKIASAVSDAAGDTAWQDVRPFVRTGLIRFTLLTLLYSVALAIFFIAIRQI